MVKASKKGKAATQELESGTPDKTQSEENLPAPPATHSAEFIFASVMNDLLANSSFLDRIQTIIKSMVKTIVDATYQRLVDYTEENRGSIYDLEVKMEENQKAMEKLHNIVQYNRSSWIP